MMTDFQQKKKNRKNFIAQHNSNNQKPQLALAQAMDSVDRARRTYF